MRRTAKQKRIDDAINILKLLGLPVAQQNERSALTLLALLGLKPSTAWLESSEPLLGVTPIMEFIASTYSRQYAPNSRETIRRETLHQFVQAGIVLQNPDHPERPTNSPKNVYQIEPQTRELLKTFGTSKWRELLTSYLSGRTALTTRYANERNIKRLPLHLPRAGKISLSPGGHNVLIKQIVEEFCPRFTHAAKPIYVGDTDNKWAFFDEMLFEKLGGSVDSHGKMPDVVVFMKAKNWLILIEAVTSHGPMNPKRAHELRETFSGIDSGLVFVTAFPDASTFAKYSRDIAWETEVWIADNPTHMIHYNGERFLGPYPGPDNDD